MEEKKATKAATVTKTVAPNKAKTKGSATKTVAKTVVIALNAENVGFKAGDVYQALATAGKALSVREIAQAAKICEEETLLGMGWLFKEGKIKDEGAKVTLA